jgi:hypothetical protein
MIEFWLPNNKQICGGVAIPRKRSAPRNTTLEPNCSPTVGEPRAILSCSAQNPRPQPSPRPRRAAAGARGDPSYRGQGQRRRAARTASEVQARPTRGQVGLRSSIGAANDKGWDHSRPLRFSAWRRYQVRRDMPSLSQGFLASIVLGRSSIRGRPLRAGFIGVRYGNGNR